METRALPPRTCNSPFIKFANFEDGKYNINLVRLVKPYANGDAYIVYKFTDCDKETLRWSAFKTLEKAEAEFDCLAAAWGRNHKMTSGGRTRNYDLPRPSASVSPAPIKIWGNFHTVIWECDHRSGMMPMQADSVDEAISDFKRVNPHCKVVTAFLGCPTEGTDQMVRRFSLTMYHSWTFHSNETGHLEWLKDAPKWVKQLNKWAIKTAPVNAALDKALSELIGGGLKQ